MKPLFIIMFLLSLASCAHFEPNPRPWTKHEKVALGWSCLASVADMYTTTKALNNPSNWERNSMLGRHPSDQEVVVFLSVTQLVTIGISHWFPDLRIPFLCVKGTVNTVNALGNTRLDWNE